MMRLVVVATGEGFRVSFSPIGFCAFSLLFDAVTSDSFKSCVFFLLEVSSGVRCCRSSFCRLLLARIRFPFRILCFFFCHHHALACHAVSTQCFLFWRSMVWRGVDGQTQIPIQKISFLSLLLLNSKRYLPSSQSSSMRSKFDKPYIGSIS